MKNVFNSFSETNLLIKHCDIQENKLEKKSVKMKFVWAIKGKWKIPDT
jgi:hypothetical protein